MLSETQRLSSSLSFAENVALLSLLSRSPIDPQANAQADSSRDQDPGRVLSFDREADLTGVLAFLSGISDSPYHVVAVCVEERSGSQGIRAVVAINKLGFDFGCNVLAHIKSGLEKLFRLLASAVNDDLLEDQVLDAIVDMCRSRIFSRIASKTFAATYNRNGKAFFASPVKQVIDAVYNHGWSKKRGREVDGFLRGAEELRQRLVKLETCPSDDVVRNIKRLVRAAHRLKKNTDFDKLFAGFTANELNPSTRSGFISRLAKLARYQECSLYLSRTAREELGLFRDAEVTVVSLDAQLFVRNVKSPTEGCLAGCVTRCQTGALTTFRQTKVVAKLQTSDQGFISAVQKNLSESRVHAEVQILSYYELHPVSMKPRVICSSKDACYLCNLLIQLHGTFHITRTHGYLYPSWRLLPIPALDHVLHLLNKSLEAKIREVLQDVMTVTNRKLLTQNVNESMVFPFSTSLPSLPSSLVLAEASSGGQTEVRGMSVDQGTVPKHIPDPSPGADLEPGHQPSPTSIFDSGPKLEPEHTPDSQMPITAAVSSISASKPEPTPMSKPESEPEVKPAPSPVPLPSPTPPSRPPPQILLLTRGSQPVSIGLDDKGQKALPTLEAGPITIHPDFIQSLPTTTSHAGRKIQIQWLSHQRAAAFYDARPRGFVDLDLSPKGVDIDGGSSECVYVAYAGEVVVVNFVRIESEGKGLTT